ncbi:MAG: prolipoprotein diacylglyceryl transferase [Bacteroidetes bacterium]|nr:prolipoprotein diacylglyceryl transferase [Bacteroidota bacterium]MDA1120558.1 prolipoprotein diacylglyceryl transferase [Bacteroidota bacterium]
MSYFDKLQEKWHLKSIGHVIVVLIVFASTGFTVLFLKQPLLNLFISQSHSFWYDVFYYVLILPAYNLVLLFYGFIFGQFSFFWEFEKRLFDRLFKRQ